MPSLGQISRLVILVLAGLIVTTFVELPGWTLPLIVLDSPLTLRFSGPWFIAAVLVVLVCAGTDLLIRLRPAIVQIGFRHTAPAWVLPSMIAAVGTLLIAKFEPLSPRWLLILAGTAIGLSLALVGEVHVVDPDDRHFRGAHVGLTALTYALALLVFTSIYSAHVRTALSGTATFLISFLLAVSLFHRSVGRGSRLWPYAAMTALVIGLATWRLNHMGLDSLAGGSLLLLAFYAASGITQQWIQKDLSWRILIEFAVAVVLGLLLIMGLSGRGN